MLINSSQIFPVDKFSPQKVFVSSNQSKKLTLLLEIWIFGYLMEFHCEILYTLPGGNLEFYFSGIYLL